MPVELYGNTYYWLQEVCHKTHLSRSTLLRWLKRGVIEEPVRDRRGWRIFKEEEVRKIKAEVRRTYAGNNQPKIS